MREEGCNSWEPPRFKNSWEAPDEAEEQALEEAIANAGLAQGLSLALSSYNLLFPPRFI